MDSVRGLVLPLLFFCWEAGVSGSSTGSSTSRLVPLVTSNMSSSTMGTGTTTAERRGPTKAIFDTLLTDDSSEETKRMTADSWMLTHTSPEAESLSSESSSSVDNSVSSNTISQLLTPDTAAGPKALVAYSITHIELTRDSVIKIETATAISERSVTGHSPTGVETLSSSETSALSTSTEAKSHTPKNTASAEALSTASTSESASPDTTSEAPLPTNGTTERETTAAQTPRPSGTSVAVSTKPWEETSALPAETTPHLEASRTATHSTEPGSTVGQVTSSAGLTASVYSPSEAATSQNSSPSETFATEGTTSGSLPISRSPLPSVHPTSASSSQETHLSLDKATAPPEPPASTPTTAQTSQTTEVTAANILWATTSGTSDTDHSPTGVQTLSSSETSVLSTSTEAKSHTPKAPASAEALSTASTSESASPDTTPEAPLPTNGTTERETTAAQTPRPSGTSVAVSTKPWEETSVLPAEITPHLEASRTATHSMEPGSTVGQVTSPAGLTASVYSPSEAATSQNSTPSETFATEGTTSGSLPIGRSPLPSVHPTSASSSQETHLSLDKATAPPEPPASTPTTAQTSQSTEVTAGDGGGLLLVRLRVASPEDLSEPSQAERVRQQLQCELHTHLPLVQVSLLRVRRG